MILPKTIVGIDNGLSGGLCALDRKTGKIHSYIVMPTYKEGDKSEVDVQKLIEYLDYYGSIGGVVVAIEEPLKHAKSSQAIRSMAISFGKCVGACEARRFPVRRIQVKDWQDAVLGKGLAKGNTKVTALKKANEFWPKESWLATERSKVPHDGIVDAALIARYADAVIKL